MQINRLSRKITIATNDFNLTSFAFRTTSADVTIGNALSGLRGKHSIIPRGAITVSRSIKEAWWAVNLLTSGHRRYRQTTLLLRVVELHHLSDAFADIAEDGTVYVTSSRASCQRLM
jgi:hypothetical protein